MLHYAPMATNASVGDEYVVSPHYPSVFLEKALKEQAFAQGQIDYLMGNNPMNGKLSILD